MDKRGADLVLFDEGQRVVGVGDNVSPEMLERLLKDVKSDEIKARYKIEIQFGQDRSISSLKSSTGVMLCWESGKRFHGGGDDMMYWCGYDDCDMPMSSDNFAHYSVVCPKCMRESFLERDGKKFHVAQVRRDGGDWRSFARLPMVGDTKFFKATPPDIARLIEKTWRYLGYNADIYLKYHPSDIRFRAVEQDTKTVDRLRRSRELRGLHIYPLARILKDTAAGAEPFKRFLAFITA